MWRGHVGVGMGWNGPLDGTRHGTARIRGWHGPRAGKLEGPALAGKRKQCGELGLLLAQEALQDLPSWNRMGDRTLQRPGVPPHLKMAVHAGGWLLQGRTRGHESPSSASHQPHSTARRGVHGDYSRCCSCLTGCTPRSSAAMRANGSVETSTQGRPGLPPAPNTASPAPVMPIEFLPWHPKGPQSAQLPPSTRSPLPCAGSLR